MRQQPIYHRLVDPPAGARFLPFLSRCLSFVSYAAGAYGLLFLLFHFYLKPDARFVVNMGLMVASLAAPNCTLWPVGSSVAVAKTAAEAGDPLRALWELLWIPIIPGISFTIFSWGVSAGQGWMWCGLLFILAAADSIVMQAQVATVCLPACRLAKHLVHLPVAAGDAAHHLRGVGLAGQAPALSRRLCSTAAPVAAAMLS